MHTSLKILKCAELNSRGSRGRRKIRVEFLMKIRHIVWLRPENDSDISRNRAEFFFLVNKICFENMEFFFIKKLFNKNNFK